MTWCARLATIKNWPGRLPLAAERWKNISYAEFDAGHMMYINLPDLQKMHTVLEQFIQP